jgi:hypothetical protein
MTTFLKFAGYILLKWTLFYIYQFAGSDIKMNWNKANGEGILLTAFMLLALPIIELVILFYPLQLALRQKGWILISLLIAIFGLELIIGWIATNQQFEVWMAIKIVLSVSLFWVMYRKKITI